MAEPGFLFFFWQRCREVEVIWIETGREEGLGLKFLIFRIVAGEVGRWRWTESGRGERQTEPPLFCKNRPSSVFMNKVESGSSLMTSLWSRA